MIVGQWNGDGGTVEQWNRSRYSGTDLDMVEQWNNDGGTVE